MAALPNPVSSQQSAAVATSSHPEDDHKDSGFPRITEWNIPRAWTGRMMSTITIAFSDSETRTLHWNQAPVYNCPTSFFASMPTSEEDLSSRTLEVFKKALKAGILNLPDLTTLDFEKVKRSVDSVEDPEKAHEEFIQKEIMRLREKWRDTCNSNYVDGHGCNAQYPSPYHKDAIKERNKILEQLSKLGLAFKDMDDPLNPLYVPDSPRAYLASQYGTSHSHS